MLGLQMLARVAGGGPIVNQLLQTQLALCDSLSQSASFLCNMVPPLCTAVSLLL